MTDTEILNAYYKRWSDTDFSDEKKKAVVADVRRCWRARTPKGRRDAFVDWGNATECVRFWMGVKRRSKK